MQEMAKTQGLPLPSAISVILKHKIIIGKNKEWWAIPSRKLLRGDLSLTCPELAVVRRPKAICTMILMPVITPAITTAQ